MVVMIIYDDRPICNSALKGFVMAISTYTIHATRQMLSIMGASLIALCARFGTLQLH